MSWLEGLTGTGQSSSLGALNTEYMRSELSTTMIELSDIPMAACHGAKIPAMAAGIAITL